MEEAFSAFLLTPFAFAQLKAHSWWTIVIIVTLVKATETVTDLCSSSVLINGVFIIHKQEINLTVNK